MFDPATLAVVTGVFLLAGAVKGVIGLGLPTVSLALLTATLGLEQAMALMLVPSFVTNLWQGLAGRDGREILRRLWPFLPFLAVATATIWAGAAWASAIETRALTMLLGASLAVYATVGLFGLRLSVPPRAEGWAGPLAGAVNGVLTGLTGSFVVPGVPYLQALGLPRDMLVQAMGVLFTLSTLGLAAALAGRGMIGGGLGLQSALAVVPALAGMVAGQRLRRSIPEAAFRSVFYLSLALLGAYIAARAG